MAKVFFDFCCLLKLDFKDTFTRPLPLAARWHFARISYKDVYISSRYISVYKWCICIHIYHALLFSNASIALVLYFVRICVGCPTRYNVNNWIITNIITYNKTTKQQNNNTQQKKKKKRKAAVNQVNIIQSVNAIFQSSIHSVNHSTIQPFNTAITSIYEHSHNNMADRCFN